jgi:hypothetical protein
MTRWSEATATAMVHDRLERNLAVQPQPELTVAKTVTQPTAQPTAQTVRFETIPAD